MYFYDTISLSRWILLRKINVSNKSCREHQNTHFMFNNYPPPRKSCRLWDTWKSIVERGRAQVTIWRMRITYWIIKSTDTHSEYVMYIFRGNSGYANAPQCYVYTYVPCLVTLKFRSHPTNTTMHIYQFVRAMYQMGDSSYLVMKNL